MSQTKAQLIDDLVQPITGALGSASAPTFSFTSDPNTGIYSPGADQLAISTGGSGRLFVDASGRVGVGTSAPGVGLHVAGSTSGNPLLRLTDNSGVGGGERGSSLDLQGISNDTGNVATTFARIYGLKTNSTQGNTQGFFRIDTNNGSGLTERMRITDGGSVLINSTAPLDLAGQSFQVNGWSMFHQVNSGFTATAFTHTNSGTQTVCLFRQGNPAATVGTITVTGGSSTAYNTSSDYRLKENITPVANSIIRLQQLKPSRFNFIANPDRTVDGFLAHEVQDVVPEAITGEKDAVDDDGNPVYQGIDQSKLVPLLTAALQEAIGEIESLKARVVALEAS